MRLMAALNVLAFRIAPRVVPGSEDAHMVRRGMEALLSILKPDIIEPMLPPDPRQWTSHVLQKWMQGKHPPVDVARQIWTSMKGGFGARDIFDLCSSLQKHVKDSPQSVLVAFTFLGTLARLALGGNYGASVARSFRIVATKHFPSILDVSAKDIDRIVGESSVVENLRVYIDYLLSKQGSMKRDKTLAGVYNHYRKWKGKSAGNVHSMRMHQLQETLTESVDGATYIAQCMRAEGVEEVEDFSGRLERALGRVEVVWEATIFDRP